MKVMFPRELILDPVFIDRIIDLLRFFIDRIVDLLHVFIDRTVDLLHGSKTSDTKVDEWLDDCWLEQLRRS